MEKFTLWLFFCFVVLCFGSHHPITSEPGLVNKSHRDSQVPCLSDRDLIACHSAGLQTLAGKVDVAVILCCRQTMEQKAMLPYSHSCIFCLSQKAG